MSTIKDSMQNFAVNQALSYIEGNPEENIPKLMALVDRFSPDGWYESQRSAIREVIEKKNNWYKNGKTAMFPGRFCWIPPRRAICTAPAAGRQNTETS